MKTTFYGYVLAVIAVFCWSFNFLIAGYLGDKLEPFQIAFGRWFIAFLILFPLTIKSVFEHRKILLFHWKKLFAMSLIAVVLQNTIIFQAGRTASIVNMSLIGTIGPIFLALFSSLFFKTKISLRQGIGFSIAFLGVLILITKGKLIDIENVAFVAGDFWMLLMTITFGVYGVLQSKKIEGVPAITVLGAMVVVGIIVLTPLCILSSLRHPIHEITWDIVGVEIYMGVFPSIVSFLCWNISLETIGALKTGPVYYLMPLFCALEAYLVFGETIAPDQFLGGILVLAGVCITAYHKSEHHAAILKI